MKYTIGLDLGINNVGWAIYDLENHEIFDKGVVRYKESSDASGRRSIRGSRRLNKRRHHRVERIARVFKERNFNTKRSYEPELLEKRIKGLKEALSEQEISNIVYYFAIHRGYIPFDDEKPDREVYECKEDEYPCEYIKRFYEEFKKYRGTCELILMKDNVKELKEILNVQSKYNNKITQEFIKAIIEIITSKREFWEGPGNHFPNQLSPYGRFRTYEDLERFSKDKSYHKYLYELLIGKCNLSIDRIGHIDPVAPSANFYAEMFNVLNDFINMRVENVSLMEGEYCKNVNASSGKLTKETIENIIEYMLTSKTVSFNKIVTDIIGTTVDNMAGYRVDKKRNPEISHFEMYRYILKQFKEENLTPEWLLSNDKNIYNKVIYILTVAPSAYALDEMLLERLPNIHFSIEEIEVLKEIKKKKNESLKYHSLSESILTRTLKDMKKHNYQLNFMQIMKKLEYEKEMEEYFKENYSNQTTSPFYMEDKDVDDLIANPQVKKTLRKAIKVINAIIKQQKSYPETIVVESAKEMNGEQKRKQIEKEQKYFEDLHKKATEILETSGYQVNPKNIEKIIYWQETNYACAYCGKPISINDVLATEVEHILPKASTMDNSSNNLTCSCNECNRNKSKRTPYEFLSSLNMYDKFKERVINEFSKMSEDKKNNLLFEGNVEKYSLKFINRNLRDASYGTIALIEELKKYNLYLESKEGYKINIVSAPGQLTSRIRKGLNLSEKDRNYLYHHAVDAMILASLSDTEIGTVLIESQNDSEYWIRIKSSKEKQKEFNNIWNKIENLNLKNFSQIRQFNIDCDNQPADNKEKLLKRSYEVLRNPQRQFADANISKFIKIEDDYYIIKETPIIYDALIRDNKGKEAKDKKLFDKLFDDLNNNSQLLCQKNDKKLYEKLKEIYNSYQDTVNPFLSYCVYKQGLELGTTKFEYLKYGIKKTDNSGSPIVSKLRYIERVTNPYLLKEIKNKKQNTLQEFTVNSKKDKTLIGLNSLSQVCTKIFYSKTSNKFIFVPINAISFKNGKLNKEDFYYKETYSRLIGSEDVVEISDVYCGEWIGFIDKKGEYVEGRYSGYNKTNRTLEINVNGMQAISRGQSGNKQAIIIYTVDILGNRYIRLDTRNIL